jgi:hypothetical protein
VNKVRRNIIYSFFLAVLLVPAPYSQAYYGPLPKEKAVKERTVSLYWAFPLGVLQGLEGASPYVKYARQGLEKSEEFAKSVYSYSLRGIKYSYEKGKDGFYYVTIAKKHAVPVLYDTRNYSGSVANLPTVLPILAQSQWLKYLETLTPSAATRFDKALDAKYIQKALGGGNHRLFDGGHTLGGAWSNIADMCAKTGCSTREQINGYFGSLRKDAVTPKGLPFMTMEKQTYDSLADKLSNYGVSKSWTYDALSYDASEILGAGISAAAVIYFLKTEQIEELSEALGAMGIVSVVSANPLLALVMISSVAYAIATGTDLNAKAAMEGIVKSSIISGALVLFPGAFLLQLTVAVAIAVLLEKSMKDENYAFAKDYAMEKIDELETWIPDIQKEANAWNRLRNHPILQLFNRNRI